LFFQSPLAADGGELDVDSNADCGGRLSRRPVENIYWPVNGAPTGEYRVWVEYFRQCQTDARIDYTVVIKVDGKTQQIHGTIDQEGDANEVIRIKR
jgi:hypothetical protein